MIDHMTGYSKIYALGHSRLGRGFTERHEFVVQEKVDGSQFSWGKLEDGTLVARSRNVDLNVEEIANTAEHMFSKACQSVLRMGPKIPEGVIYRGEYLRTPKHNTCEYARLPKNHLVLFDVMLDVESYTGNRVDLAFSADSLDIDLIPELHRGPVTKELLEELLTRESFLGGCTLEGVVLKQYKEFDDLTGKLKMAKVVRPSFREEHATKWKNKLENMSGGDIVQRIGDKYAVEARWHKAIQHLRDDGRLKGEPADIGPLMRELVEDFEAECKEAVMQELWGWAHKDIKRRIQRGFPEFYRQYLIDSAFEGDQK